MIFTIAGNKALFEGVFGETLSVQTTDDSGVSYTVATTQADPLTLPLLRLPDEIKTRLNTVTFDEPPDFGPVSYE